MLDFDRSLAEFETEGEELKVLARAFLSNGNDIRRYVLGRNQHALTCLNWTPIDGVVDDFAPAGDTWNGTPIIPADHLPVGAVVVNCSMSIRPVSAHARLASIAGVNVLSYADLVRVNRRFPLPDFVREFRADYVENEGKWHFLASRLNDATSNRVLHALMAYRLTADYHRMSAFSVRFGEQYFDPVITLSDSEVFVDCGGYDGDTVLQFCSRTPRYKHIYMFEPSPTNFEKAQARLATLPNLSLIRLGVSDKQGVLSFDPGAGSASSVKSDGPMYIDVVTIDEHIAGRVSYIKMDLEGWEIRALEGTKRHIVHDHPKLAISVYHHASDFWRIPEYVLSLRDDYDIYLRHYSEGWSETVMYFIPRGTRAQGCRVI